MKAMDSYITIIPPFLESCGWWMVEVALAGLKTGQGIAAAF